MASFVEALMSDSTSSPVMVRFQQSNVQPCSKAVPALRIHVSLAADERGIAIKVNDLRRKIRSYDHPDVQRAGLEMA